MWDVQQQQIFEYYILTLLKPTKMGALKLEVGLFDVSIKTLYLRQKKNALWVFYMLNEYVSTTRSKTLKNAQVSYKGKW